MQLFSTGGHWLDTYTIMAQSFMLQFTHNWLVVGCLQVSVELEHSYCSLSGASPTLAEHTSEAHLNLFWSHAAHHRSHPKCLAVAQTSTATFSLGYGDVLTVFNSLMSSYILEEPFSPNGYDSSGATSTSALFIAVPLITIQYYQGKMSDTSGLDCLHFYCFYSWHFALWM